MSSSGVGLWGDFEGVLDVDGIEDGLEVMVAVGTAFYDVEPEVDLGDGEELHNLEFRIKMYRLRRI
jgi:hypothetical protein